MFRTEAAFRESCKKERDDAIKDKERFQSTHNDLVQKNEELKHELERKQRLSVQAIAARGNMKQHLDDANLGLKKAADKE